VDLERMAVRLRPRNAWEALDLGVALVRSNFRAVYAAWLPVYVPVAIVAHLVFVENAFWAWLLLWWLKPAFDRAVLAVLAPALFGEARPARAFLSAPTRAWRRTGLFPALTWRRFDLARSFHLPAVQLERLSGKPMAQRVRILDRDSRGAAVWLSFLLLNLELILTVAVALGIELLLPVQTPIETLFEAWGRGEFAPNMGGLAGSITAAVAMSVVEPLYVACGFTLYLQRRTHLEGWDIELRFRQMAARLAGASAAMFFAIALAVIATPQPAHAAPPASGEAAPSREIKQVLSDKVFGHSEPKRVITYVGPEWKSDGKAREWDWGWLEKVAEFLSGAIRIIAWGAAVAVIAFALYFLARYVRARGLARARAARPDFLFGLDVRPGSLPDDVGAAAEALVRRGAMRDALSLLYRAALVRFMDDGLEFLQGDTEGDCIRRVESFSAPQRRFYFMRLVLAWQSLAYAHRAVEGDALIALAREWRSHFTPAQAA
jgi:hypothetical protein